MAVRDVKSEITRNRNERQEASRDHRGAVSAVSAFEKKHGIHFSATQRNAILQALENGVFVITGGPGTGKTTTINAMIHFFESEGLDIFLAAPTGRAAKRMTEATGYEARTIHRMLELGYVPEGDDNRMHYGRNEENPR